MIGKKRTIALALAGVVASAGAGWAAGASVKSPAQVAAERKPPKASLVTAEVERKTLSSNVITRGTVRYGQPKGVSLPGVGGGLVTRPPVKGESLR